MSRRRKSGDPQPQPEPKRYRIVLTRAAERALTSLPRADLRRIDPKIQALAEVPRPAGVKKLEGMTDLYRIRSGDYRIVYQIEEARLVILVVHVGNRRDIYRNL